MRSTIIIIDFKLPISAIGLIEGSVIAMVACVAVLLRALLVV
jgi:hypothetical protein